MVLTVALLCPFWHIIVLNSISWGDIKLVAALVLAPSAAIISESKLFMLNYCEAEARLAALSAGTMVELVWDQSFMSQLRWNKYILHTWGPLLVRPRWRYAFIKWTADEPGMEYTVCMSCSWQYTVLISVKLSRGSDDGDVSRMVSGRGYHWVSGPSYRCRSGVELGKIMTL